MLGVFDAHQSYRLVILSNNFPEGQGVFFSFSSHPLSHFMCVVKSQILSPILA